MNWICKHFNDLSVTELYAILRLRVEVFCIEQNCIYQDIDNKDQTAYHLMGMIDDKLVAYARILPASISYDEPSIGRVVTSASYRRSGIGKELMKRSIEKCIELFETKQIKIGAQLYLKNFYESLGFVQTSDVYLEDGIEHIEMVLTLK